MTARFPDWIDRFAPQARAWWWLHEGPFVWLVEEGAVDVFATRVRDDRPAGTRRPLYRVPSATVMLHVERELEADDDHALIAIPLPQSRIRAIPLSELQRHGGSLVDSALLFRLVSSWVDVLAHRMPMPPRDCLSLPAGETLSLQAGQSFCPLDRLAWVRVSGGSAALLGDEALCITSDMPALPLRSDAWSRALAPLSVSTVDENLLMASGELWQGLAAYQRLAIRRALRTVDDLDRREIARLEAKAEQTSRVMHDALSRVVGVAQGEPESPQDVSGDPLLAACQLVGRCLDIGFREPPKGAAPVSGIARLEAIVDASGVRMRAVALKGEWWTDDNGPLLAFAAETHEPCALLPTRGPAYEMHVPRTGRVEPVTAQVAQTLAPFATQFYRPLPAAAIRLRQLLEFAFRGQSRDMVAMVMLGLLGGLLGLAIPVATGHVVDSVIPSARRGDAIVLVLALVGATLAAQIFEFVRSIAVLRVEAKMDGAVQSAIWDRVLSLPVPFFRDYTAGDLANRINGINVIRHALSGTTVTTLLSSLFALVSFLLLFYYSVPLAVVAMFLTVPAIAVVAITGLLKLRYERQLADLAGHLSGRVLQYLIGIVKLRVAAAEHGAFANWAKAFTRMRGIAFRAQGLEVVDHTFFAGYSIIVNAVIFAVIGMRVAGGSETRLSTGDFVAFSAAFSAFFVALVTLSETALGLLNLLPIYRRAKPILETLPEANVAGKHPGDLQGSIDVVNLGFAYPGGQEVLKDVSFSVRAGEFIALVGPSGSGKSTLFRLLLGFETPGHGSIFYDNQDLAELDVRAVRRQMGVVLQSGQLMTGDILSNIVGSSQHTIEAAWEAARRVGLDEDIEAMPMGMHTLIGEASSTLSVGQRQRILVARAIIHRPRILLFDEATSALDNHTQAIVSKSLEQLQATRIVIAHRLSTVIHADRIIVLQNGRIVQTGRYDELITKDGPFAELAKRQIA